MATTIPTLSPGELREQLQEILQLAEDVVVAQSQMRAKAAELRRCDWETERFANAVSGELRGVYELLVDNAPEDGLDVDELSDRIVDTIGVLDMAIATERDDAR